MELARPFAMSQPAISRHVRVLADAGLISQRVDGARRPCRLEMAAISEVDRWLDMLREALAANYDRLDALLAEIDTDDQDSPPRKTTGKEKT
jgi:DNA-binding transcriptional ArsR family regulator